MSSIILSSRMSWMCDDFSGRISGELGYRDVTGAVFATAAAEFSVSESDLRKAVDEPPSLFGMSLKKQRNCIAWIQSALMTHFLEDGVLYCGRIGHLLMQGVAHVVSVGIVEPVENQVDELIRRKGIDRGEAQKLVKRSQKSYERLVKDVLEEEEGDLSRYDLVLNINKIERGEAVDIIRRTVESPRFRATTYSRQLLGDFELAHRVRGHLVGIDPDVRVRADGGNVEVESRAPGKSVKSRTHEIRAAAERLEGVKSLEIRVRKDALKPYGGAER